MPSDVSKTQYPAFLVPDAAFTAANLAADSVYACPDPIPGQPVPTGSSALALSSSGYQSAGTLTITTQQGGTIGREGATFIWSDGTYDYGWDAPTVLTGWQPLVWSTTPILAQPFLLPLQSGTLLALYASGTGSNNPYSALRSGATWGTPAAIDLDATGAPGCSPCAIQLADGKILLFAMIEDTATDTVTARMLFSDNDGSTWTVGASGVLPVSISVAAGASGFTVKRMRVAMSNDQILLLLWLKSGDTTPAFADELRQYASSDGGHTFKLVWTSDRTLSAVTQQGGGYPEVVICGGAFVVGWLSLVDTEPVIRVIESAYQSLGEATDYTAVSSEVWGLLDGTGKFFTDGDFVMVCDETGVLYITGRQPTVTGRPWLIQRSTDVGQTWAAMARSSGTSGGGKWWDGGDNGSYPYDAHGAWWRGQLILLHRHAADPSTYDGGSLSFSTLGGYSSATMPGYDAWRLDTRQVTWGRTYVPYDVPSDMGWTATTAGAPTAAVTTGLLVLGAAIGESIRYHQVPAGTVAGGIMGAWAWQVTSGTAQVILRVADVGEGYQLTVTLTTTTLTVYDGQTGASIDSAAASGEVEILCGIREGGVASVWYRTSVADPCTSVRGWILLVDAHILTDDAGATWTASRVDFGLAVPGGVKFRRLAYVDDEGATYTGNGLGGAQYPAALLGRRYATVPVELVDRTSIQAAGGPTYTGEEWTITTDYERPPSRLHGEVSPSLRDGARFDYSAATELIWTFHTSNTGQLGYPLAFAALGTNAPNLKLYGYNAATPAWVLLATLDMRIATAFSWTRTGRMVKITSVGTPYYAIRNQHAGGWMDLGGGKLRKVLRNTEGQVGATTSAVALFELEGVDDTEGTSGTGTLYVNSAVWVLPEPAAYSRYKVKIDAFTHPDGYLTIGKLMIGSIHLFARLPSNGRKTSFEPQIVGERPPGGVMASRRLGPSIVTKNIPMEDLLTTYQLGTAAPDYVRLLETTGEKIAALDAAGPSLIGLLEEVGAGKMVYLDRVPIQSSSAGSVVRDGILYGSIRGGYGYNALHGNEYRGETWTLDELTFEGEP
jgi:hypothetical protein